MARTRMWMATAGLGLAVVVWRVLDKREAEPELLADAAEPRGTIGDEPSSSREREGDPTERGSGDAVRLDLSRAEETGLRPVVEFLTFVQRTRGESSHLLFVRYDDLDQLAQESGATSAEFLTQLDQLGVVVSHN